MQAYVTLEKFSSGPRFSAEALDQLSRCSVPGFSFAEKMSLQTIPCVNVLKVSVPAMFKI